MCARVCEREEGGEKGKEGPSLSGGVGWSPASTAPVRILESVVADGGPYIVFVLPSGKALISGLSFACGIPSVVTIFSSWGFPRHTSRHEYLLHILPNDNLWDSVFLVILSRKDRAMLPESSTA